MHNVVVVLVMLLVGLGTRVVEGWAAEKMFFSSNRPAPSSPAGSFLIWWMNPDGSGLEPITSGNFEEGEPRLSPDGRTLLFTRIQRDVDPLGNCSTIWV